MERFKFHTIHVEIWEFLHVSEIFSSHSQHPKYTNPPNRFKMTGMTITDCNSGSLHAKRQLQIVQANLLFQRAPGASLFQLQEATLDWCSFRTFIKVCRHFRWKNCKHMAHTGTFGFFTASLWNCETTYLQWHDALSIYRYLISQATWTICHPSPFFSVGATSGGLAVCGTLSVAGRGITSLSAETHEMKIMKYQTSGSGVMMSAPCDNMRQLVGSTCF